MKDDLETLIRELESKLPDLRRLIAEGEMMIAASDETKATAERLALAIRLTDAEVSALRRALLGAMMPEEKTAGETPAEASVLDADYNDAARELERILEG